MKFIIIYLLLIIINVVVNNGVLCTNDDDDDDVAKIVQATLAHYKGNMTVIGNLSPLVINIVSNENDNKDIGSNIKVVNLKANTIYCESAHSDKMVTDTLSVERLYAGNDNILLKSNIRVLGKVGYVNSFDDVDQFIEENPYYNNNEEEISDENVQSFLQIDEIVPNVVQELINVDIPQQVDCNDGIVLKFKNLLNHTDIKVDASFSFNGEWIGQVGYININENIAWMDTYETNEQDFGRINVPVHTTLSHNDNSVTVDIGYTSCQNTNAKFTLNNIKIQTRL